MSINRNARFANFVNEFTSYVDPFRMKALYDPLKRIDRSFRSERKIQVGMIKKMEERLSKIEVCSGWEKKRIHRGYVEDEKFEMDIKYRLSVKYLERKAKGVIDKYVPGVVKKAVETARKATGRVWPQIHKDYAMKREYSRRLADWEIVQQHVRNVSALPLKALARLEYFAVGVESVADSIKDRSTSDSEK